MSFNRWNRRSMLGSAHLWISCATENTERNVKRRCRTALHTRHSGWIRLSAGRDDADNAAYQTRVDQRKPRLVLEIRRSNGHRATSELRFRVQSRVRQVSGWLVPGAS
eukprot:3941216-Rhodomonas_salina.2